MKCRNEESNIFGIKSQFQSLLGFMYTGSVHMEIKSLKIYVFATSAKHVTNTFKMRQAATRKHVQSSGQINR